MANEFYDVRESGDEIQIVIRRTLDINTAPALSESVDQLVAKKPARVVVDISALDIIDSSGVAVLVKMYKGIRGVGGKMNIIGARDQPLAIFKLLRMDKVFGL